MDSVKKDEFLSICNKFRCESNIKEVFLEYEDKFFFNKMKHKIEKKAKIGEVVFGVFRKNGKVITVRSQDYPNNIFRIPSGGIKPNENVLDALYREVGEELGLKVEIREFLGVINYHFKHKLDAIDFFSYMFILDEKSGNLLIDSTDDEVCEIIEADFPKLLEITNILHNISGSWQDWGHFRYESTNAILRYMEGS